MCSLFVTSFPHPQVSTIPKSGGEDTVAPSRVVDLQVNIVNVTSLRLKWTASGGDFDQGNGELDPGVICVFFSQCR